MNTPQPFDLYTHVSDHPDQQYVCDLLVAAVADGSDAKTQTLAVLSDPNYAGQALYIESADDDLAGNATYRLTPVRFDGSSFVTTYSVTGYAVSAQFDDGMGLVGVVNFTNPVPLGNTTDPFVLPISIDIRDLSSQPINWS